MRSLDSSCRHQWIVTRWNTQEKYRVAELLMCQHCCKIRSWTDVVDQNHVHESVEELTSLVVKYAKKNVDPDALRESFMCQWKEGALCIPDIKENIKSKYDLYPPPEKEEEDKD